MILLLDIIECELEIKPSVDQQETPPHRPDFLLPIHIRQEDKSSQNDIIPLLNQWKLIESPDDLSSDHFQDFYRICPTVNNNESDSPKLQVYYSAFVFSRIEFLLYLSSCLSHRTNVKWNYFNNIPMMI
jgi:hypothetical protein